jgi:hypothetical protein
LIQPRYTRPTRNTSDPGKPGAKTLIKSRLFVELADEAGVPGRGRRLFAHDLVCVR